MTFSEELQILKELRDYLLMLRLRADKETKSMTREDVNLSILHAYSTTLILLLESLPEVTDVNRIQSLRQALFSRLESASLSPSDLSPEPSHSLTLYWNRIKSACYHARPLSTA